MCIPSSILWGTFRGSSDMSHMANGQKVDIYKEKWILTGVRGAKLLDTKSHFCDTANYPSLYNNPRHCAGVSHTFSSPLHVQKAFARRLHEKSCLDDDDDDESWIMAIKSNRSLTLFLPNLPILLRYYFLPFSNNFFLHYQFTGTPDSCLLRVSAHHDRDITKNSVSRF